VGYVVYVFVCGHTLYLFFIIIDKLRYIYLYLRSYRLLVVIVSILFNVCIFGLMCHKLCSSCTFIISCVFCWMSVALSAVFTSVFRINHEFR